MESRRIAVTLTGPGGAAPSLVRPQLRHDVLRAFYESARREDMTYRAIAESLGVSAGIVSRDMRALGLGRGANGGQLRTRKTRERRERLAARYRELAAQNLYAREIAEQVGVTKEEVRRDLRALGLSRGKGPRHGGLVADDGTVTQRGRNFTAAGVAARQARVAQRVAAGVKTCSKCGESKSLTDFTPNRRSGDGRDGWCRPCRAASRRQPRTEKTCPDCERTLPLPAFNSDRSRFDGRACYCRDCAATRLRELTARRNGTEPGLPLDVRRQWAAERTKKACSLCERTLPLEEFTARRGAPDGRDSWCKECARAQQRERQQQRVADLATMTAAQRQAHETALAWRRPATGHAERECCYGNGNGQHARGCPIGRVAVG